LTDGSTATASPRVSYLALALAVAALATVSNEFGQVVLSRLSSLEDAPAAPAMAASGLFALCSFASFYATRGTALPSFVAAIALGIAGRTLFAPIVDDREMLTAIVTASAAIVLFGGGLEMPLRDFVRLFVKIALLAGPGVILTGFALSQAAQAVAPAMGAAMTPAAAILLGAILASTDPAAIVPLLQPLKFKRRAAKDIVIAESALNDVVGAMLTTAFLKLPLAGLGVAAAYGALWAPANYRFLAEQAGYGALFGIAGFAALRILSRIKRKHAAPYGADQVYFLATPVIVFAAASAFGGSGFLAAFIAGLCFHVEEHMAGIERFFHHVVDGVAKPAIFLLLGAMVDLHALISYAPAGIAIALVFVAVLRPAMVLLMLGPYALFPKSSRGLSLNEIAFVSFIRETGAIPAVLLVTAVARAPAPVDGLVEIGMWTILVTLTFAPPLTPYLARRLGLAQ
jgi:NhaP-type Na+/H+ or K+/H+ antiporter